MKYQTVAVYGLSFAALLWTVHQDDEPRQSVETLAKIHWNWGPALNSPGAALRLKETSRQRGDNFTVVRYRMYAEGLPQAKTYSLLEVVLPEANKPQTLLRGISFDET